MPERSILHRLTQRLVRVWRHLFGFGEHTLTELAGGRPHSPVGAVCALVLPLVLHGAAAGNDVLALLTVTGIKPESHVFFIAELVCTVLVWTAHARGGD